MGNNVCNDFYSSYPISRYLPGVSGNVGIGGIVIGFVYFMSSAITISWIRTQQLNALRGMEGAAKHVIFPIYLPIMWISALSDAFRGLVIFFVKTSTSGATSWENSIIIASAFGIQHFVIEGIAVILIQYGCGMRAIRVASMGGGAVGIFTFLTAMFLYRDGGSTPASSIIYVCWLFTLTVFYAILWLVPQEKLYRRPAAIFYAKFWTLLTGLVLIADGVGLLGPGVMPEASNISTCVYNVVALPILVLFKPFVMYTTLLMESKWWQGLLIRPPEHAPPGRGSSHRAKLIPNRPDRLIRSIDQALDMLANETSSNPDLSRGTSGSDSHTSERHSHSESQSEFEMPRGFFSSFYYMLADAFCLLGGSKSKYSSVSQRSDEEAGRPSEATAASNKSRSLIDSARKLFAGRNYDQLKGPLLGVEVGFSEAQELAMEVDNMNAQGTVKLLNFAYLKLQNKGKNLLGTGSFSKVYVGTYRNLPVAVKMLFTQDLNPDVIKRCINEARILTEISPHPNVVHIYGVAVLPPSVCLVLEICKYGSLADVLRGPVDPSATTRSPLSLTLSDRMYLALGCAKGLQALHAYSPLLCHRDVKSYNFLIDDQLNAKIADLDLGYQYQQDPTIGSTGEVNTEHMTHAELLEHQQSQNLLSNNTNSKNVNGIKAPVPVGGSNMCIYWQAPEVLLGQQYTQKSDIHSLALVIWEIISAGRVVKFYTNNNRESSMHQSNTGHGSHVRNGSAGDGSVSQVSSIVTYGSVPYGECKNMKEVRERILKGYRPIIPAAIGTPSGVKNITGGLTHPPDAVLLDILQLGWHPEPSMRPDIDFIVEGLMRCWRNSLHSTIFETEFIVDQAKIQEENFKLTVLQDYNTASNRSRGGAINMASTFLGAKHHLSHNNNNPSSGNNVQGTNIHNAMHSVANNMHHEKGDVSVHSANSNSNSHMSSVRGSLSTYSRSQGQQRIVRKPPSPEVIASLLLMQSEPRWSKLEDEGAYLVLTPLRPFFMLWATKKWTQLTGYLVNDVIAYDVSTLLGPKADHFAFEECLESVGLYGRAEHIVSTIYRRDGKPMSLSVHMFPVFDSSRDAFYPDTGTHSMDSSYRISGHNASFVGGALLANDPSNGPISPGHMNFSKYTNSTTNNNNTNVSTSDGAGNSGSGSGTLDPNILNQMLTSTTPVQIRTPIKVKPTLTNVSNAEDESAIISTNATAAMSPTPMTPPRSAKNISNSVPSAQNRTAALTPDNRRTLVSTQQQQRRLSEESVTHTNATNNNANANDSPAENDAARPSERMSLQQPSSATAYSPVPNSPTPNSVTSPRRSTSNVYTSYNNQVFIKSPVNTGQPSFNHPSGQNQGLLSRTSSFAGSCSGDDSSVVGISNCMEHMQELAAVQLFHSSVEQEAAQRRVAYIAVQFSSISDAST